MSHPVYVPRVNNNDDVVKVVHIAVAPGDAVATGDLLMEVETEKAVVEVAAERDGYVLAVLCESGQSIAVGAVAMWCGATPEEAAPQASSRPEATDSRPAGDMTAKARMLLRRHGLAADLIPRSGPRLLATDIEAYLATQARSSAPKPASREPLTLPAPAEIEPLSPAARGMLATVTWHRDQAAAAYLEIEYDPRPWDKLAADFMGERRLLLNPLLALMAHRLAQLAPGMGANGTILEDGDHRVVRYRQVNLGFTVQAGEMLYLCVVAAAEAMTAAQFVTRLSDLQRRAMGHKLTPAEMRGATIGFTSMARWGVQRHQPILPPHTGAMIAHTAPAPGGERAILGITYDHRLLSGFAAVRLLKKLVQPGNDGA
ncbi:MAG TPA: 2-oxo acid dehydrogenase subunit E2 [Acetobacteraceae bacterium]|nr:2-oxo acid dehydrogenase subunit E2 [Acetobacteraceae bacterium]